MKGLALAVFALALTSGAPAFAQGTAAEPWKDPLWHAVPPKRPAPGDNNNQLQRPTPQQGVPNAVVPHARWRTYTPGRVAGQHKPFRFRGNTFTIVGSPIYVAPWVVYPYVWDSQWGPRYSDPSQPGDVIYFCSSPQGYSWEVADCPGGWWPIVPGTYQSGFLSGE
jgi:hypothetical protein